VISFAGKANACQFRRVVLVELADVRIVQRPDERRLPFGAGFYFAARGKLRCENLDGNRAVEAGVTSTNAHAARIENGLDLIRSEIDAG